MYIKTYRLVYKYTCMYMYRNMKKCVYIYIDMDTHLAK